jgi:hypothetical protein
MSSDASHDRLIGTVSLILDRMVHVRLTAVGLSRPEVIDRTPADPVDFWEQSRCTIHTRSGSTTQTQPGGSLFVNNLYGHYS